MQAERGGQDVHEVPREHNASARSVARNALSGYGLILVSLVSGFVATPLVLRAVGGTAFGAYSLVGGLVGYLALADAGVGTTTSNRVARLRARRDEAGMRVLLATSFWFFCVAGTVGFAVAVVIALGLEPWFGVPPGLLRETQGALLVLALAQGIGVPLALNSLVLVGVGRQDVTATQTIVFSTLSTVGQVAVATAGGGILGIAVVSAGTGVVGALVLMAQVRRRYPDIRVQPRAASGSEARMLLGLGSRNVLISIAGMISFTSDLTILGALAPLSVVAAYALASKLVSYVRIISSRLTDVLMPVYAHGDALGLDERQRRVATSSTTLTLGLAVPLTICCVAFGGALLRSWLGTVPAGASSVLVVLSLASLAQLPGHSCFALLTATERTSVQLRVAGVATVANLALSIGLTMRYGIVGPALGSLVVSVVADVVVLPLLVCRDFGWDARQTARETLRPLLAPTVVAAAVAAALAWVSVGGRVLPLVVSATVCLVFWGLLSVTAFSPAQRGAVLSRLRRQQQPVS